MTMKPMTATEREFRRRWGLADDDPGPVTIRSMLFGEDHARRIAAERDAAEDLHDLDERVVGDEGGDGLDGSGGHDRIVRTPMRTSKGNTIPAKLPLDVAALERGDFGQMVAAKLPMNIDSVLADPSSAEIGDGKIWPVPGNGAPVKRKEIGPNGKPYSDGRYAPRGGFRGTSNGKPIAHYGIDLAAPIGEPVRAAEDRAVYAQGEAPGFGKYTAIRHSDGRIGIYAHLSRYQPMRTGTKVAQGQEVGNVGVSGNAIGKGSHLHFEVREDRGKKSLGKISNGAVSVDPSIWTRTRRVVR